MQDMQNIRFLLRDTAPAAEARSQMSEHIKQRLKERSQQPKHLRNPVESYPSQLLFFLRVTLLLRGLCSSLNVTLPYLSILSPYAKLTLVQRVPLQEHATNVIYPSPILSPLEQSLRRVLHRLYVTKKIIGCQVAVYHKQELIVNLSSGLMGRTDPRPVRPDTLFNIFSVSKAVAATTFHAVMDHLDREYIAGRSKKVIRYDDHVASVWKEFGCHGKEKCTIAHALSHRAGLENSITTTTPLHKVVDWDGMLRTVAESVPSSKTFPCPTAYHFLSYGHVLGGIVRGLTGQHIRDVFTSMVAKPLGIEQSLFMQIPSDDAALHDRIATLANGLGKDGAAPTPEEIQQITEFLQQMRARTQAKSNHMSVHSGSNGTHPTSVSNGSTGVPSTPLSPLSGGGALGLIDPCFFNLKSIRQACIPSANVHGNAQVNSIKIVECIHIEVDGMKYINTYWILCVCFFDVLIVLVDC